ncbi:MAG: O-antigen ligase family protein [Candidatus Paceibacterota bacterium]
MKNIIKYFLYVLAFIPLVIAKSYFFPYISGKNLLIRWIVTIVVLLVGGYLWYNREFREDIGRKVHTLLKNPLGIAIFSFIALNVVSTLFAFDSYRAFFGDIERGEGLLGLLFFFGFFVFSYLLFEYKDWVRFFQISLGVSFVLFFDALVDFSRGVIRPTSFTGNPIYLAEVFLFALFSAGIVFWEYYRQKENKTGVRLFWIIASIVVGITSFFGIFITETRGVIVGVGVGIILVFLYVWYSGKNVHISSRSLSRIAGYILLILVFCGVFFFSTKNAQFWQKIPGFDRLAQFTLQDNSTQTRLISAGVSLDAVNPSEYGVQKFLLGWGPENFNIAYNANYNPRYFEFENKWFDRAHNKIFDVLVMNGVIGLLIYLSIWGLLLWYCIRGRAFSFVKAMILFFGTAYFIQNLTVFDSIITYILWFGFLGYVVAEVTRNKERGEEGDIRDRGLRTSKNSGKKTSSLNTNYYALTTVFSVVAIFFFYTLIFWTVIPFSQMSSYLSLIRNSQASVSLDEFKENMDSALHPYTYAQDVIRTNMLDNVKDLYKGKESEKQLVLFAIDQIKDLLVREPYNPRYWANLGGGYDALGKGGLTEYLPLAQEAYQKAQELSPQRQDLYYMRAYNLGFQKRYNEAITVLKDVVVLDDKVAQSHLYLALVQISAGEIYYDDGFDSLEFVRKLSPGIYQQEQGMVSGYYILLQHYYKIHDKRAKICAEALQIMVPEKKDALDMIIKNIDDKIWQPINFQ